MEVLAILSHTSREDQKLSDYKQANTAEAEAIQQVTVLVIIRLKYITRVDRDVQAWVEFSSLISVTNRV